MLEELLKCDRLGTKNELLFVLFHGLSLLAEEDISNLRTHWASNSFSIGSSFDGILCLLEFISFIKRRYGKVKLNTQVFDPSRFQTGENYFDNYHFFKYLFSSLKKTNLLDLFLNEDNLKFDPQKSQYYIKNESIPFKMFPIRNLLLSLEFLTRDDIIPDHLYTKKGFKKNFEADVVNALFKKVTRTRKISLDQLEENLRKQKQAGEVGELFVLEFENKRLANHPRLNDIKLISKDHVNAGYDIESFNDQDSLFVNRFIEVKSYSGYLTFYWSENEIKVAKEREKKYFLYLVNREKLNTKNYRPLIYQNPYETIFNNDLWKKEANVWKFSLKE